MPQILLVSCFVFLPSFFAITVLSCVTHQTSWDLISVSFITRMVTCYYFGGSPSVKIMDVWIRNISLNLVNLIIKIITNMIYLSVFLRILPLVQCSMVSQSVFPPDVLKIFVKI